MATIINNIYLQKGFAEIEVISENYREVVLVDINDMPIIGKVNINNRGYAVTRSELVHRLLMGCTKGDGLFIDHLNGNPLDNRRENLRITTDSINKRNLHSLKRSKTGLIGVQYREVGNYKCYRASYRLEDGKRVEKHFNINIYGDEKAFDLAKKWLEEESKHYGYI